MQGQAYADVIPLPLRAARRPIEPDPALDPVLDGIEGLLVTTVFLAETVRSRAAHATRLTGWGGSQRGAWRT